ncbi:MAG: enoyl-CoA hydratase-related protein [Suipraeoptans sp.]
MQYVKLEKLDDVNAVLVTISREKALNALNTEVLTDIGNAFVEIEKNNTVSSVILTGEGNKSFVAGADIAQMKDLSKEEAEEFSEKGQRVFRKIDNFHIPVIAAINGFALGGGLELALACDIRIASENASFAFPETGLGITPGFGGTQRLMRTISIGKAKEMIFSGERIGSDEAVKVGLVNDVTSSADLIEHARHISKRIARNSSHAIEAAKRDMNEGINVDIDKGLDIEAVAFGDCFETIDQKNRMEAFVNKSKH